MFICETNLLAISEHRWYSLRTYPTKNKGLYAVTATSVGRGAVEESFDALLRPHFTLTLSLSISSPLAHA
jgi:hypothetical protein